MLGFEKTGNGEWLTLYILDASVAVKWVLSGEPLEDKATKLKDDFTYGLIELRAPSLIIHEIANSLWKATKQERILPEQTRKSLRGLEYLQIPLEEFSWDMVLEILDIANKLDMATYDAVYLFLGEKMKAQVVTADDKLYQKAKGQFRVLHLKDYV